MGGGRNAGRTGFLVLESVGCEDMSAAREHFVITRKTVSVKTFLYRLDRTHVYILGLTFPCSVRSSAGIRSILKEWTARRKLTSTVQIPSA